MELFSYEAFEMTHEPPPECKSFAHLDLSGMDFRGRDLSGYQFNHCGFHKADLSGSILDHCVFTDCDMLAATLEHTHAEHTTFERTALNYAKLHQARLAGSHFEGGSLDCADVYDADFRHVQFEGVQMTWTHVTSSNFDTTRFVRCNLNGTEFIRTDLNNAVFEGVNLCRGSLYNSTLAKSVWRKVDLSEASLFEIDCSGAEFHNCQVFGLRVCRVQGVPRRQEYINCAGKGEPPLIINDIKLAPFLYEVDRNDAMGRLVETLSTKLVLLLGRFTTEPKLVLDRLHRVFRTRGFIPAILDSEFPGLLSADDAVRALALCARFVVVDVTDAQAVRAEVPQILSLRAVPVQPLVLAGHHEPIQFRWLRRHYPHLLLPLYEYSTVESLIDNIGPAVINPCERELTKLRERM